MSDLRVDGIFYLPMKEGESRDEAEERFLALLNEVGIEYSEYSVDIARD